MDGDDDDDVNHDGNILDENVDMNADGTCYVMDNLNTLLDKRELLDHRILSEYLTSL